MIPIFRRYAGWADHRGQTQAQKSEVCAKCGERTYSPEVTDKILYLAKHEVKPIKTIEVPVFDLAEKA